MLRIAAPSASVLPPAPAQKSTTISPRLASERSAPAAGVPSSCTSIAPRVNSGSVFCSAALAATRRPSGEYGVGSASTPAAGQLRLHLVALELQVVDAQVQRRRAVERLGQRPEVVAELRLQRLDEPLGQVVAQLLGQRAAVDAPRRGRATAARARRGRRAGSRRCRASRGWPGAARPRRCPRRPGAGTAAARAARRRWSRRASAARAAPGCGDGGRTRTPRRRPASRSAARGAAGRWPALAGRWDASGDYPDRWSGGPTGRGRRGRAGGKAAPARRAATARRRSAGGHPAPRRRLPGVPRHGARPASGVRRPAVGCATPGRARPSAAAGRAMIPPCACPNSPPAPAC